MPKLSDVMRSSQQSAISATTLLEISAALSLDPQKVNELIYRYGGGYIYTPSALVVADSPRARCRAAKMFGVCVIISATGVVSIKTAESVGNINRKNRAKELRKAAALIRRDEREYLNRKRTEKLFEESQMPCFPKHGGRANSHADIGKYVERRFPSNEPRSETRFKQIHIPSL